MPNTNGKIIDRDAHTFCASASGCYIYSCLPPVLPPVQLFIIFPSIKGQVKCVQEKLCFFPIKCNPSLAYIAVRDLQSSQFNASVQSLLWAGSLLLQPIAAECWRGRGGKLSRILRNKAIFNEHPVSKGFLKPIKVYSS